MNTQAEQMTQLRERIKMLEDAVIHYMARIEDLQRVARIKDVQIKLLRNGLALERAMRKQADEAANVLHRLASTPDGEYVRRMVYGKAGRPID